MDPSLTCFLFQPRYQIDLVLQPSRVSIDIAAGGSIESTAPSIGQQNGKTRLRQHLGRLLEPQPMRLNSLNI